MISSSPYVFKLASEDYEFEQVHSMNYQAFVEEIPQHPENNEKMLLDQFHRQNAYVICMQERQLVGMVAVRAQRPFSLDAKLNDLDSYLPPNRTVCEVRLLSIEKSNRNGTVILGLLRTLVDYGEKNNYNLAVISGTVRQMKFYSNMGCIPFGPLVGSKDAQYQPMYLKIEDLKTRCNRIVTNRKKNGQELKLLKFMPGPVNIKNEVRHAMGQDPVSHRSETFVQKLHETKNLLCHHVGARSVEILMGSGTQANDAIAAQLSLLHKPGLILCHGEFGERLLDHATRFNLQHNVLRKEWGEAIRKEDVRNALDGMPGTGWLWSVHCETSTGILTDLEMLKEQCKQRDIRLCLDCISSLGTIDINLGDVYLASGVSGKALGSLAGLSLVFYNHDIRPSPVLPRSLDLGYYAANEGVPFTLSSNLVNALHTAVKHYPAQEEMNRRRELSKWLRGELRNLGLHILGNEEDTSPAVITIALPQSTSSEEIGIRMEKEGFLLYHRSKYLRERNWIQICLMGDYSTEMITPLLELLNRQLPNT